MEDDSPEMSDKLCDMMQAQDQKRQVSWGKQEPVVLYDGQDVFGFTASHARHVARMMDNADTLSCEEVAESLNAYLAQHADASYELHFNFKNAEKPVCH